MISPADNLFHAIASDVTGGRVDEAVLFAGQYLQVVPQGGRTQQVLQIAASVANLDTNAADAESWVHVLSRHFTALTGMQHVSLQDGVREVLSVGNGGVEFTVRRVAEHPAAYMVTFRKLDTVALARSLSERVTQLEARVTEFAARPHDSVLDRLAPATATKLEHFRTLHGLATPADAAQRLIEQGLNGVIGRMAPDVGTTSSRGGAR